MINLEVKNCNNEKFKKDLEYLLNAYELDIVGTITIDVSNIICVNQTLSEKWAKYVKKSTVISESDYISEWSPNNNSEIGKLRKNNYIIDIITNDWYNCYSKYESVNMINILDDFCYILFDYSASEVVKYIEKDNLDELFKNRDENSYTSSGINIENFKEQFLETLDVYFDRNPKFRMDW